MKTKLSVEGWWQQLGRRENQTMELCLDEERFDGRGRDCIGEFVILNGELSNSEVSFIKRYDGAHEVLYHGKVIDLGEGQIWRGLYGFWHGLGSDEFELHPKSSSGEIHQIVATAKTT